MSFRSIPIVALTMGDPTGVGPEIIAKAMSFESITCEAKMIVFGSPNVLQAAFQLVNSSKKILTIQTPEDLPSHYEDVVYCIPTGPQDWTFPIDASIQAKGGEAAYQSLVSATRFALDGRVDAIVTCPLHKVALKLAGHDWPGHTELLASLCGVEDHAMMLYLPPGPPRHGTEAGFGVVHVTLHMALREVFEHVNEANILEKIGLAQRVFERILRSMNIARSPRIAVAALNPHGGEGGRFGREEINIIEPAVQRARQLGLDVVGPLPTDTLMPRAVDGAFDAVVAMYHDQGHIALKLLDMFDAVNITLGLPIVRTSVAHGTAHDIAWQNRAEASGMVQAIQTAVRLTGLASVGVG
jgi:4-hydroxythreonine-4-phosphate dehydrogenase